MSVVKRTESQFAGPVPTAILTLSVLLCIGALSHGSTAAAVMAQSLGRHGTTADERASVASFLSSLSDAARKLCPSHTGQSAATVAPNTDLLTLDVPTALRPYDTPIRCHTSEAILPHLLNLPPPVATI